MRNKSQFDPQFNPKYYGRDVVKKNQQSSTTSKTQSSVNTYDTAGIREVSDWENEGGALPSFEKAIKTDNRKPLVSVERFAFGGLMCPAPTTRVYRRMFGTPITPEVRTDSRTRITFRNSQRKFINNPPNCPMIN